MFEYKKSIKPMEFIIPSSVRQTYRIESDNKIIFIYEFLEELQGLIVIEVFNTNTKFYEVIYSTKELVLQNHDSNYPLDSYELLTEA